MQEERHERTRLVARNFGRAVRAARERAKWTQQQLSEQLCRYGVRMDTSAITRIENGSRDPRLSEAEAFASALGVPLSQLISADSSMAAVVKLSYQLDAAAENLVAAVYEYGVARRALLDGLGNDELDYPTLEPLHELRELAGWGAIRDFASIKADLDRRTDRTPPYDEAVFDAET